MPIALLRSLLKEHILNFRRKSFLVQLRTIIRNPVDEVTQAIDKILEEDANVIILGRSDDAENLDVTEKGPV